MYLFVGRRANKPSIQLALPRRVGCYQQRHSLLLGEGRYTILLCHSSACDAVQARSSDSIMFTYCCALWNNEDARA